MSNYFFRLGTNGGPRYERDADFETDRSCDILQWLFSIIIIPSNEISNILTVNFAQEIENKSIGSFLKSIVPPDGNSVR